MVNGRLQTIAGVMGNVLEWYDFSLMGFFSDVISQVFFPKSSEQNGAISNLMKSFAIYGGAFLMRPIGGMAIGYIGDKYGRKKALVISLFLMAFPTVLMGCLPTYERIGHWSTVLLVICRLLQGVSVGGQLPASLIYTVETRPRGQWGYYGSLVMMAANIGTLLGNLVGALLRSVLTDEELFSWGWRIPFLSGILIAGVAIYLKIHGEEHHPNEGEYAEGSSIFGPANGDSTQPRYPLKEAIKKENLPALASATLTPMLYGAGFYTSFVWMPIYMSYLIQPPVHFAFWVNAMALLFGVVLILPSAGMLSDLVGRLRTMVIGAIGLGLLGPIMMVVISLGDTTKAFVGQWVLGLCLSLFGGPLNAWLVEKFPAKIRMTACALGYDLAHCTASAFSPLLATALAARVGPEAPGLIYPLFAGISLIGLGIATTKVHYDSKTEERDSFVKGDDDQDDDHSIMADDCSFKPWDKWLTQLA